MTKKLKTLLYISFGIFFTFVVFYSYYNDYLFFSSFTRVLFGLSFVFFLINLVKEIKEYSQIKKLKKLQNSIIGVFFLFLITSIYLIQEKFNNNGNPLLIVETPYSIAGGPEYYLSISFGESGKYLIVENTLESYGNNYYRGKYTYADSIFYLDKIKGKILKSNMLGFRYSKISADSKNPNKMTKRFYLANINSEKKEIGDVFLSIVTNKLNK
ncbi:hypothetical protein BUL40_13550 [Croceivirga radicis]|uniref:Uncharacterized protein n=1 Tax=Croceivirga radicis TaxID=1929488 RepID=A0A1V6LNU2_9FLAO|nr:hypothetical protein [Croceivirga radicis]OQD41875.1 hypothetical protein BUL40_13550 [Croceivirga radicis]